MKNLLIATTALVATAGVASADVTFSGAANFGVINTGGTAAVAAKAATATTVEVVAADAVPAGDTVMYNNVSVTAAMSGETDGGLTFGASLTMRSGDDVDLDVGDITNAGALSATSLGNIYVSGDFGKLTFDDGGIDNAHNDDYSHDVMYEGTFGALSVTVTADIDGADQRTDAAIDLDAAVNALLDDDDAAFDAAVTDQGNSAVDGNDYSIKLSYSANGLTLTGATDDGGEYDVTAAYAINDMLTASVNFDSNGGTVAGDDETIVKVAYANDGITAALSIKDGVVGNEWAVALGYAANGLAVNLAVDDGGSEDLSASYDLGGGMSVLAGANEGAAGDRAWFIGSKMSF